MVLPARPLRRKLTQRQPPSDAPACRRPASEAGAATHHCLARLDQPGHSRCRLIKPTPVSRLVRDEARLYPAAGVGHAAHQHRGPDTAKTFAERSVLRRRRTDLRAPPAPETSAERYGAPKGVGSEACLPATLRVQSSKALSKARARAYCFGRSTGSSGALPARLQLTAATTTSPATMTQSRAEK